MRKFLIVVPILFFLLMPIKLLAQTSLNGVSLSIDPKTTSSVSTWKIGFLLPEGSNIGHILISLGGYAPDLSQASLSVSGLPKGTAVVGKSNPSCVSNCDDIRYYFNQPVYVKAGTNIVFTLSNVKNPSTVSQTGLGFISIFSSRYPNMTLVFSSGERLITLLAGSNILDENLIPETVTANETQGINNVLINELFYQPGAATTKLTGIKDPTKVENFTLDLLGKEKIVFMQPLDLSKPEAVQFITKLSDYLTFDTLAFKIDKKFTDYFKVPIELTFYNLPYVWDLDILKDDQTVLAKDKLENFNSAIVDDKLQISFVIHDAGSYKAIPHFELNITDNQEIKTASNLATFTGRISDPKAIIKISLNGKELPNSPLIDAQKGEFTLTVQLQAGPNLIEANATSQFGKIEKITKIVNYIPPTIPAIEKGGLAGISPINVVAIGLAILAIILIIALRYLVKRK